MKILLNALVIISLAFPALFVRADFNSALDAYEAQDYKSAFEEFTRLAEIGEKRAQDIITNRPYQTLEELMTRAGIPQNVFDRIKEETTLY